MSDLYPQGLMWLRRDLRLDDNAALSEACKKCKKIAVVFVFDTKILKKLKSTKDQRVSFIFDSLLELDGELRKSGSQLILLQGDSRFEIPKLVSDLKMNALFYNEDYEPEAKKRDLEITTKLSTLAVDVFASKDQVIFAGNEILKSDGSPYQVFTPYKRAWLKTISSTDYSIKKSKNNFMSLQSLAQYAKKISLKTLGFQQVKPFYDFQRPGRINAKKTLKDFAKSLSDYEQNRDFPYLESATSGLSVHLRFGTVSIRECIQLCMSKKSKGAEIWLSELIWREFYQMILDRFPYVANGSFKKKYDNIKWSKNSNHFKAWCDGQTGFPIVDAGMRQLNQTGWMHNRVRMIVASFLVKDLLLDWRKGEAYFAEKLLDFDLASNNGGWQWCASTGCDAQPYFRVFNPSLQSKRFDPEALYIKKWVQELNNCNAKDIHDPEIAKLYLQTKYTKPLVSHSYQKKLALEMFKRTGNL